MRRDGKSKPVDPGKEPCKMAVAQPDAAISDQQRLKKTITVAKSAVSSRKDRAAGPEEDSIMIDPFGGGIHLAG